MRSSFDALDGAGDDSAAAIDTLQGLCDDVTPSEIVAEMARLQDAGCELSVDGVGEEEVVGVKPGDCVDTGSTSLCSLVGEGVLSCADDFCPDCGKHSGECDRTCSFCGGKHSKHGHRRLQISLDAGCSMLNLMDRVDPVNEACCDPGAGTCDGGSNGVPTVCDAKCAIVYTPFFADCEPALRGSFAASPETIAAFVDLDRTCTNLQRGALLPALASATSCAVGTTSVGTAASPPGPPSSNAGAPPPPVSGCSVPVPVVGHGLWVLQPSGEAATLQCDNGFAPSSQAATISCTKGAAVFGQPAADSWSQSFVQCVVAQSPSPPPPSPHPLAPAKPERGLGPWLDSTLDCSLLTFQEKIGKVDSACCTSENGQCDDGPPTDCSPMCGAKLLDFMAACSDTLTLFFDGLEYLAIAGFSEKCLDLPASQVLAEMERVEATGCTIALDGVAETEIVPAESGCTDKGSPSLCATVDQGVLDCAADFCPGSCTHAGQCDRTCSFCRRRSQGFADAIHTSTSCSPAEFAARTDAVDAACCNGGELCADGVPTACDAECAPVFTQYYSQCHDMLSVSVDHRQQDELYRFSQTCDNLPIRPMLTALAQAECSAGPPACTSNPCQNGGQCTDSTMEPSLQRSRATSRRHTGPEAYRLPPRHRRQLRPARRKTSAS